MVKAGRNQPCPCGSGIKTKRCCGVQRGPSEAALARAFVAVQGRQALPLLASCERDEFIELFDEMLDLPEHHLAPVVPLPAIFTPELERLARVVEVEDDDEIETALGAALPPFDTPLVRAQLARAVIAQRDASRIGQRVAAMALVNLASESLALLRSALIQAVAVATGAVETPSGILVARR